MRKRGSPMFNKISLFVIKFVYLIALGKEHKWKNN